MKLLLDTHTYLWWLSEPERLGDEGRSAISHPRSIVHVSAASFWELSIKAGLGRLELGSVDLVRELAEDRATELPMTARHALRAGELPRHHSDPFDRMLVAQAQLEGLVCVTSDPAFPRYGVPVVW